MCLEANSAALSNRINRLQSWLILHKTTGLIKFALIGYENANNTKNSIKGKLIIFSFSIILKKYLYLNFIKKLISFEFILHFSYSKYQSNLIGTIRLLFNPKFSQLLKGQTDLQKCEQVVKT